MPAEIKLASLYMKGIKDLITGANPLNSERLIHLQVERWPQSVDKDTHARATIATRLALAECGIRAQWAILGDYFDSELAQLIVAWPEWVDELI
jgi:hypothetical protein